MEDYPEELLARPRPVVLLAGSEANHERIVAQLSHVLLDPTHNKTVPCFTTLSTSLDKLDVVHERKDRRSSYDGYSPQGLLKADYMKKHAEKVVSVVVLLFHWDSSKNAFDKDEQEISAIIEELRSKKLRSARAAIVVTYEGSIGIEYEEAVSNLRKNVDGSADKGSSSRLRWFTSASSASSIGSFALDDFAGSVQRLEKQILELSHQYYKDEAKRIKRDRDILNRRVHPHVFVRNHFKIAFLAEFRADFRSAMKYYTAAYNYLRDVPRDVRILPEIKTLADYINLKLCTLALTTRGGEPGMQEAITQFQRHDKIYKGLVGKGNEGVHWAWLSRQFRVFGELLCRYLRSESRAQLTMKSGLLHPGYYFHFAAALGVRRQKAAAATPVTEQARERHGQEMQPVVLAHVTPGMEYYGQHPITLRDPESGEERAASIEEMLEIERVRELNFDHISANISLFHRATKEYSIGEGAAWSKRLLANISTTTARLLVASKKWDEAVKELVPVIELYRAEKWWLLLSDVLCMRLECARALKDSATFVFHTLELMASDMPLKDDRKAKLLDEMLSILRQEGPLPALTQPVAVHTDTLSASPLVDANIRFLEPSVAHGGTVLIDVLLTSHFVRPLAVSLLALSFSLPSLELDVNVRANGERGGGDGAAADSTNSVRTLDFTAPGHPDAMDLTLMPHTPTLFRFKKRIPLENAFTGTARCEKMSLHVEGGASSPGVVLQWPVLQWSERRCSGMPRMVAAVLSDVSFQLPALDESGQELQAAASDTFRCRIATDIVSPPPPLRISTRHLPPALTNEMYRLEVLLANEHDESSIESIQVSFSQEHGPVGSAELSVFSDASSFTPLAHNTLRVARLAPGHTSHHVVYLHSASAASKRVVVISAKFTDGSNKAMSAEEELPLPVVLPVSARCAFFTPTLLPAAEPGGGAALQVGQNSLVRVEVQSTAPFPVQVVSCDLQLNEGVAELIDNTSLHSSLEPKVIFEGDKLTTWFNVLPKEEGDEVALGMFNMRCRRAAYDGLLDGFQEVTQHTIETPTLVPTLRVVNAKCSAEVDLPAVVVLGDVFPMSVSIRNASKNVEEFALSFKESSHFLFSGAVSTNIKVLPFSTHTSTHNVVALSPGKLVVPHAHLYDKRAGREVRDTRQKQYVFVQPPVV